VLEHESRFDRRGQIGKTFAKSNYASLEDGGAADVPITAVRSITRGVHTLSTMSTGMSADIVKPSRAQGAGISKLFASLFDAKLGLAG